MDGASTRDGAHPARVELLSENRRNRVARFWLPDGRVLVRKEPLGPDRERRLRQELGVLRQLSGVDGVVELASTGPLWESIALQNVDGYRLSERPLPLTPDALASMAAGLARALAGIHGRGVFHRNVTPSNVLIDNEHQTPVLTGFSLATAFAEIHPEFSDASRIEAALAYLAPEQTGRMGRPVDHRADLYALGALLYELATGAPPFGTGDPLRLSHDHLTRVPVPPATVREAVPTELSDVIMHLLEKEPDNRYQTAEGLVYDLDLLRETRAGPGGRWQVGGNDFPRRLRAPTRVVGRDSEIAVLDAAFSAALTGRSQGVMISGPNGVGKSSLINELRSIASARDGWFVAGKYDQHRRDQESDAVWQAFRGLGRLLLAAPEDEVADVRRRLLASSIGPYAGMFAALHPGFAALLEVTPAAATGDPLVVQARLQAMAVELVRIVATPKRPLVFVVDDLQWAGRVPLGFLDMVLSDPTIEGLLVVGTYREDDIDEAHPLHAMLSRWQRSGTGPQRVRLGNLAPAGLATLLGDMLRLDARDATELAEMIAPYTQGNPYNTVELLNSLRNDGVLTPGVRGWQWDRRALRHSLDRANVIDLLAARADAMPAPTRQLLDVMACLGGRVDPTLLQAATGQSATDIEQRLGPALHDGLLVAEPGAGETIRFNHDQVQETLRQRLDPAQERILRLRLGRRLRNAPAFTAAAAELYLPVIHALREADERREVAALLRRAAEQAKLLSNYALVERCLTAAVALVEPTDRATLIDVQTGRLWAYYSLGRLDEVDELYHTIDQLTTTPLDTVEATLVQVSGLTNGGKVQQALHLCLRVLGELGHEVPTADDIDPEIERGLDRLYRWVEEDDRQRPDLTDPTLVAVAELIKRAMAAAYLCDRQAMGWLIVKALRIWADHGPARQLVGAVACIAPVAVARRGDYRVGHRALQRILATCQARDYEPDTSVVQYLYSVTVGPWFDPLEDNIERLQVARQRLIHGGDLQYACFTYLAIAQALFDCAPTVDSYLAEVEAGVAFAERTGNTFVGGILRSYQTLAHALRDLDGRTTDFLGVLSVDAGTPLGVAAAQFIRTLGAILLGDPALLARHSESMMRALTDRAGAFYDTATMRVVRAIALAGQIRSAQSADQRAALLHELDSILDWLAARADDAPVNFLHLLRLVEAERAWALGDFRAAAYAFDVAQGESATRRRPWHRALIKERTARLYLSHGMENAGHALLAAARGEYLAWGAMAKVRQLDRAHPNLRGEPEPLPDRQRTDDHAVNWPSTMSGAIDLFGIVAASQALSSATSIEGLRTRVVQVLSEMTGATSVHLLVRNPDEQTWLLPVPDEGDGAMIDISEAGSRGIVPMSVIRYVERTSEPLLISDAVGDDRFMHDPYVADMDCCSMLAVPILSLGVLQALLILENRFIRAAFSAERIDAVMLVAGQLAVSLDNARVYASLERKVAKRTAELALANQRLEMLSGTDALTGLANRRRFEAVLADEWQRAEVAHTPLSLAMVDIDHFKRYNDQYGHLAGDEYLQRIAAQLLRHSRQADLVSRYGGEEFAVVMPDTSLQDARTVAERLRAAVSQPAQAESGVTHPAATVSIGLASVVPTSARTPTDLISAADAELYAAKRGGRNRVNAAEPRMLDT